MNLVKWKLLETFTSDRWANWGLSIPRAKRSRPTASSANGFQALVGPLISLERKQILAPKNRFFFSSDSSDFICVSMSGQSLFYDMSPSVTICLKGQPDSLFNDLIACLKGEGMLRWTSPWEPQASQDRCLKMSWFLLRFCFFIQNLRVWWLGQFQTFNARCKSMHLFWGNGF